MRNFFAFFLCLVSPVFHSSGLIFRRVFVYMENTDKNLDKLLRDVAVLSKLKEQQEDNYNLILNKIKARRNMRIFSRVALSCAAVALLALVFTFSFTGSSVSDDIISTLDAPTLITESGEKIALADDYSYALELGADKEVPSAQKNSGNNTSSSPVAKARKQSTSADNEADTIRSVSRNTVMIPRGFTYDIKFDDGSVAHLNSNSYIEFPKSFENRQQRIVSLTGEGYFKVAKSEKPFIVKVGDLDIKVYGTEFNINTNKKGRIETLLVSGSVGVKKQDSEEEIILKPNDMLVYNMESRSAVVKEVVPDDYLAWMSGDFTCSSQPLFHLIDEISAFYGITIEKDPSLENQLITISLSRQLGYMQIMEIMSRAFGLEFNKLDNHTFVCKQTN